MNVEQRRDVVTVGVGVGEDDDLAVAQPGKLEVLAKAAAKRRHEIEALFSSTLASEALSVLSTLPRSEESPAVRGRGPAWPAACESPSTTKSSLPSLVGLAVAQFSGQVQAGEVALLRETSACAAQLRAPGQPG
jgi:hypothetical protein